MKAKRPDASMKVKIPVAHDFTCPWCWVGLFQARKLQKEFGVEIEWLGYELWPESLGWPELRAKEENPNRPKTPSRLDLQLWVEQVEIPKVERPKSMRIHDALEAVEYAKTEGTDDALVEALYRAYWEHGLEIGKVDVILQVASGIVRDLGALKDAVENRRFDSLIVPFDKPAYRTGVYNVPTFFVGEDRIAEQPYAVIRRKVSEWLAEETYPAIYLDLAFPEPPVDRPYVFLNMVATIDGKTVTGSRDDSVVDLGSKVDHVLMKRIENAADAVLLGAQTLRATSPRWNPRAALRIVVTGSGDVPLDSAFMREGEAYIATAASCRSGMPSGIPILSAGERSLDFRALLKQLRNLGVQNLCCLGGSEVNAQLLRAGLVDELFLTIAPKVKLGRAVPTYAGGEPLEREDLLQYRLIEHHTVEDEVFLRYRSKSR
ncbi:MAG TPA: dihydrofolate reductase family protein [Fimbriimonas sp.]